MVLKGKGNKTKILERVKLEVVSTSLLSPDYLILFLSHTKNAH